MTGLDAAMEPPAELHGACVECGVAMEDDGWCRDCAAWERREAERDE